MGCLSQCLSYGKCSETLALFFFFSFFWLRWVFVAARRLSLVAVSGGYSSLCCKGFSLQWLLLLQSRGSRRLGFRSYGTWAQELWLAGSVAPRHVGSSQTRARTRVPCIGRQIPNHCATREARALIILTAPKERPSKTLIHNLQRP